MENSNTAFNLYAISLPNHRRKAKSLLMQNKSAYNSLSNKDSNYAKQMKALQDLHRQAYEIYENAPDEA